MYFLSRISAAIFLILQISAAIAGSKSDSKELKITGTVVPVCQINEINNIDFGDVKSFDGKRKSAGGQIIVVCSKGVKYKLTADAGKNTSNKERILKINDNMNLKYDLIYTKSKNPWEVGENIQGDELLVGSGDFDSYTIKVRINTDDLKNLDFSAESKALTFEDTVTVTLEF